MYSNIPVPARLTTMTLLATMMLTSNAMAGVSNAEESILTSSGNFSLTCWQQGIKILDRKNLASLSENPTAGQKPIQFMDRGKGKFPVLLYDLGQTLCLVQGEP